MRKKVRILYPSLFLLFVCVTRYRIEQFFLRTKLAASRMNSFENQSWIKSRLLLIQNVNASSPSSCRMLVYKLVTSYEYKAEGDVNSLGNFRIKSQSSLMYVFNFVTSGFNRVSRNSLSLWVGDIGPAMIGLLFKSLGGDISTKSWSDDFKWSIISLLLWILGST